MPAKSIECPFCSGVLEPKIGTMKCPECHAKFEYDDRMECVFVDTDDLRMSVHGTVCPQCGLVQGEDVQRCLYCGQRLEGPYSDDLTLICKYELN